MSRRKYLLIAALGLSLATLPTVARAYRVAGSSDVPAFLHGDLVLVNQGAYDFRVPFRERPLLKWAEPGRGDVVLFRQPRDQGVAFKTVMGLPGEQLEIRAGRVTINGHTLRYSEVAPHLLPREVAASPAEQFGPIEIPENHYFLLGANPAHSIDSRHYGPVPGSEIRGEVYLNLSRLWRRGR